MRKYRVYYTLSQEDLDNGIEREFECIAQSDEHAIEIMYEAIPGAESEWVQEITP